MRDRPNGRDLLAIARETFAREILPALGPERRLAALMVANALSIVERELAAGDAPARAQLEALASFYGETLAAPDAAALARESARLCRRLAQDLRHGRLQGPRRAEAHRILLAEARTRVAESNPKALGR
jgi:hypothetical protein